MMMWILLCCGLFLGLGQLVPDIKAYEALPSLSESFSIPSTAASTTDEPAMKKKKEKQKRQQPTNTENPSYENDNSPGYDGTGMDGVGGNSGSSSAVGGGRASSAPSSVVRKVFPQERPEVCLAFLSCCGRTDLLAQTLHAAVRHMEVDEATVRYEVAWVDNGSGPNKTKAVDEGPTQVEHKALSPQNMGLAWGLNTLFFDLCTAPFVLILEEDWMYMDESVAPQTNERKTAVGRALEVGRSGVRSFDGRKVMGAFLRPETYDTFLKPPHAGPWQRTESTARFPLGVEFRVYCGDASGKSGFLWGSYTNGAGLYNRTSLREDVGLVFGEPGDGFHDAYVEANYAYRASLTSCHALLRMEQNCPDSAQGCNAAFYHIGGGRGTRPNKVKDIREPDDSWIFYGTPSYSHVKAQVQQQKLQLQQQQEQKLGNVAQQGNSGGGGGSEAESWERQRGHQEAFQEKVASRNERVFAAERAKREEMRGQANLLRTTSPDTLRHAVPALRDHSDEKILDVARELQTKADSPHPLPGFWDGMGNPFHGAGDDVGDGDSEEDEGRERNGGKGEHLDGGNSGSNSVGDSASRSRNSNRLQKQQQKHRRVDDEAQVVDEDEAFLASVGVSSVQAVDEDEAFLASVGVSSAQAVDEDEAFLASVGVSSTGSAVAVEASTSLDASPPPRKLSFPLMDEDGEDEEGFEVLVAAKKLSLLQQAALLRKMGAEAARRQVPEFRGMSDAEVLGVADTAERTAGNHLLLEAVVRAESKNGSAKKTVTQQPQTPKAREDNKKKQRPSPQGLAKGIDEKQRKKPSSSQQQQQQPETHRPEAASQSGQSLSAQQRQLEEDEEASREWRRMGTAFREAHPEKTESEVVAVAWKEAAQRHEAQGRRAFSGGGYQDQHKHVHALLQGWRQGHDGGGGGKRGATAGGVGLGKEEREERGRGAHTTATHRDSGPRGGVGIGPSSSGSEWGMREILAKAIYGPNFVRYL